MDVLNFATVLVSQRVGIKIIGLVGIDYCHLLFSPLNISLTLKI